MTRNQSAELAEYFSCNCGVLGCNGVLILTNILVWFSLGYSVCRLGLICHWLLQKDEEEIDYEGQIPVKKHCLWEIAGMILISYEAILSLVLCIGTGSFVFEVQGFFVLMWCLNYPVFLICHWVLGFFLTKCCSVEQRMRRASSYNCCLVVVNLSWRALLYWCGLNLIFHPKINADSGNNDPS